MRIQSGREVAEKGTVQRLPVPAMDEHDDRACAVAGKEIDPVPYAGPVGNRTRGVRFSPGRCVPRPPGDMSGVFRNPRPVVVLGLVVDGRVQGFTKPVVARPSAPKLWSCPTGASIRGHLLA